MRKYTIEQTGKLLQVFGNFALRHATHPCTPPERGIKHGTLLGGAGRWVSTRN